MQYDVKMKCDTTDNTLLYYPSRLEARTRSKFNIIFQIAILGQYMYYIWKSWESDRYVNYYVKVD